MTGAFKANSYANLFMRMHVTKSAMIILSCKLDASPASTCHDFKLMVNRLVRFISLNRTNMTYKDNTSNCCFNRSVSLSSQNIIY